SASGAEMLDGHAAVSALEKLPEGVQNALFGPGQSRNIQAIADVAAHVQRTREGTGALFIIMRYPSAALTLASGMTTGLATGSASLGASAAAGSIVLAPYLFSKILTSPTLTKLFVQTIKSPAGNMKSMALKTL